MHQTLAGQPLVVRLPESTRHRLDDLANRSGLTRSQIARVALDRLSESDLSRATFDHAQALRPTFGGSV